MGEKVTLCVRIVGSCVHVMYTHRLSSYLDYVLSRFWDEAFI